MFTQKCFIRKNSKELQDKVYRLGHRDGTHLWECTFNTLLIANEEYFRCYDDEWGNADSLIRKGYIDCGINENLFLALAALQDDTDADQWFVYPKENHWFKFYDNNIEEVRNEPSTRMSCQSAWFYESHKATPKELIEYFKDK